MRLYIATRTEEDGPQVSVQDVEKATSYPLKHILRHSPNGFEWHYGGSGPADLALSILADYFGEQDIDPASFLYKTRSERLYQAFKWRFIAPAPRGDWILAEGDITAWLKHEGEI